MEASYQLNMSNFEDFIQKNLSVSEQNERQKQYQQMLFESKIYNLSAFQKCNLLFNVGKKSKFLMKKPSIIQ